MTDYTDEDLRHCACDEHGECGGDTARCCFRWHTNLNAKSAAFRAEARRELDATLADLRAALAAATHDEWPEFLERKGKELMEARQSEREACERILESEIADAERGAEQLKVLGEVSLAFKGASDGLRRALRRLRERAK